MAVKYVSRTLSNFRRSFASMTENFAEVNGLRLNYAKNGSGSHNVLCLPGALGSWRTDFGPQLDGLDTKAFTTVAWDPPGYGSSRPPDRDFSKGFFARDATLAHGLMEKLGLCPYSVLGWSDGGLTAIFLAHQQRKTDALRKLVIWGANSYVSDEEARMYRVIQDVNKWSKKMRQPMVDMYGEEYFQKTWNNWTQAFLKGFYEEQQGNICRELLPEIETETLIIHGVKDPLVPMEHPAFFFEKINNSIVLYLKDAKHNLHLRYGPWFNSTAAVFLLKDSEFDWPCNGYDLPPSKQGEEPTVEIKYPDSSFKSLYTE